MNRNIPYITTNQIKNLISIEEVIGVQQSVFYKSKNIHSHSKNFNKSNIIMPLRTNIPTEFGSTLFMPAYIPQSGFGLKIVSIRPGNTNKKLPTLPALILLFDAETGLPLTLMDASYLTSLRTAAASAVATKFLSNYLVKKISIFGAGPVAKCHVDTLMAVRGEHVEKIVVWNRTTEKAQLLVDTLKKENKFSKIDISVEKCPNAAVIDADIIVTATSSNKPLFDGKNIKKGAHINCVGSFLPSMIEVDSYTIKNSLVVVDTKEAALEEAGDLIQPIKEGIINKDHIQAELSEIISTDPSDGNKSNEKDFPSSAKQIRKHKEDITLFKSCGLAIQDISVAGEIYRKFITKEAKL